MGELHRGWGRGSYVRGRSARFVFIAAQVSLYSATPQSQSQYQPELQLQTQLSLSLSSSCSSVSVSQLQLQLHSHLPSQTPRHIHSACGTIIYNNWTTEENQEESTAKGAPQRIPTRRDLLLLLLLLPLTHTHTLRACVFILFPLWLGNCSALFAFLCGFCIP